MLFIDNNEKKASVFSLTVAIVFSIACFWKTDAEVYLFPRIVAVVMIALGLVQLLTVLRKSTDFASQEQEHSKELIQWKGLFPGFAIILVFVLSIEAIGFYTGSFLAFLCIVLAYGKRKVADHKALLYKAFIGIVFMLTLYGLFWKLLYVRTPIGWLI